MVSRTAPEFDLAARQALQEQLGELGGLSALMSAAIAARAGINSTDLESLDLLRRHGPMTAGRLADLTGLTTGAITGVIDRLERRGYARRQPDPGDRRRVIVGIDPERAERDLGPLYGGLAKALDAILADYSDEQIALLDNVTRRINDALRENVRRLREPVSDEAGARTQQAARDFIPRQQV